MRTNQRIQMGSALACALALMGLSIGTALAAVPSTTAYHFSSHPMISGTVVTVNDRQMVVDTDQGEQVTLEVDSRTMAPRDLAPGMVMRVEFLAMEDCRFYAQRIMPIRGGMSTQRLQAYAQTRDSREAIAHNASMFGATGAGSEKQVAGETDPGRTVVEPSPGRMMTATPTTAAYQFSTRPMVSGRVVSVNDHRLVVETDQGQKIAMVMDSHTMVPGEVAAGTVMRAEFVQMKDGRYYAKRISRNAGGVADREPAYAHTRDSDAIIAGNAADCGFVSSAPRNSMTSALESRERVVSPDPVVAQTVAAPIERPATLPQTASRQPLLLLLGGLGVGAAALLSVARGLRIV